MKKANTTTTTTTAPATTAKKPTTKKPTTPTTAPAKKPTGKTMLRSIAIIEQSRKGLIMTATHFGNDKAVLEKYHDRIFKLRPVCAEIMRAYDSHNAPTAEIINKASDMLWGIVSDYFVTDKSIAPIRKGENADVIAIARRAVVERKQYDEKAKKLIAAKKNITDKESTAYKTAAGKLKEYKKSNKAYHHELTTLDVTDKAFIGLFENWLANKYKASTAPAAREVVAAAAENA